MVGRPCARRSARLICPSRYLQRASKANHTRACMQWQTVVNDVQDYLHPPRRTAEPSSLSEPARRPITRIELAARCPSGLSAGGIAVPSVSGKGFASLFRPCHRGVTPQRPSCPWSTCQSRRNSSARSDANVALTRSIQAPLATPAGNSRPCPYSPSRESARSRREGHQGRR